MTNSKDYKMKIEIDYDGACAIIKVNGKYLHQCDKLTRLLTFSAFRTIEQDYCKRESDYKLKRIQNEKN